MPYNTLLGQREMQEYGVELRIGNQDGPSYRWGGVYGIVARG